MREWSEKKQLFERKNQSKDWMWLASTEEEKKIRRSLAFQMLEFQTK